MSNQDSRPIKVTAEERAHPAIRLLARFCIGLAQDEIAKREAEANVAVKDKIELNLQGEAPSDGYKTSIGRGDVEADSDE